MSGREPLPLASGLIERLLAEDVPGTDLTTEALGMGGLQGRMEFRARPNFRDAECISH